MNLSLHSLKNRIYASYHDAARRIEHQSLAIGLIGVIGFLVYYLVWQNLHPQTYESLTLRGIGAGLFFMVMTKDYWPQVLLRYFPLLWYVCLGYSLAFFPAYMLLMNQLSHVWMMTELMSIFLLIILVDWISLAVLSTLGVLLAMMLIFWNGYTIAPTHNYIEDLILFPYGIIAGVIFRYRTDIEAREKLTGVLSAASSIAHELRTPLLGIKSGINGLKRYIPILFDGYELARAHELPVKPIRKAHYHALYPVLRRIEDETDYSNVIIDMLLMNAKKQSIDSSGFQNHSMKRTLEEAISRYPFTTDNERKKVRWNEEDYDDFVFWGSDKLIEHVLFNLLKNALYFIAKAEKGEIIIWFTERSDFYHLHFHDTGTGIHASILPHIFDKFYSTTNIGTGIGLSFCHMVMEAFGGHISCRSTHGEYTEFVLSFPKGGVSDDVK